MQYIPIPHHLDVKKSSHPSSSFLFFIYFPCSIIVQPKPSNPFAKCYPILRFFSSKNVASIIPCRSPFGRGSLLHQASAQNPPFFPPLILTTSSSLNPNSHCTCIRACLQYFFYCKNRQIQKAHLAAMLNHPTVQEGFSLPTAFSLFPFGHH